MSHPLLEKRDQGKANGRSSDSLCKGTEVFQAMHMAQVEGQGSGMEELELDGELPAWALI